MWGLLRSPWGKAFTALRDNPIRAESLGVNIQAYTLLSFAIGAVYAGVAGALFASLVQFIEPAPFAVGASIMMYLMVVVGGPGYFFGPLLGSAVGVLLPEWLRFAQGWYLFVFGAAVVLLMLWLPDGLLSIPDRLRARRQAREASAARAARCSAGGRRVHRDAHASVASHDRAAAESDGSEEGLRRDPGRGRRVVRGDAGRDLRRDRPQRVGQDDHVQQRAGADQARQRAHRAERARHHAACRPLQLNRAAWAARSRRCRCSAR